MSSARGALKGPGLLMRSAIKNGYVRALAFARVDRIMREIQARSGTILVLKLHRISPVSNPYWAPLTPEAFDALAAFLTYSGQCSTFAGLPPMKAAASRPVVVLSFDDGYRDFIEYAMPILHRYGIRANQNVIGLSVETGRPPWTIMVSDALSAASPERVRQTRIVGFPHRLTGTDDVSKARFGAALSTYLKVMHPLRRRFVWPEIQTLLDETSPDRWTKMMSSTELQEVASTHELGCHSYSHESMEHLDDRQFCVDFDQCRSLFDTIDRRINVYAFPNDSYRRTHIDILRERGVEHVLVGPDPKAHLIGLRQRVPIYGDSEAELRLRAMAAPFPTRTWPHSSWSYSAPRKESLDDAGPMFSSHARATRLASPSPRRMSSAATVKSAAKAVRSHPVLNIPITTALRAGIRRLGRQSPWLTKHLPRSGVVKVRLPNGTLLRLWSRGDDWISTQIFWQGPEGYEPETVGTFFRLAERAAVTVDLGAYVGYFTVMAALANHTGRVIALEPSPATFDRLQRNVNLNRLSNVISRNVAAGASSGTAELHHIGQGMSMAASLDPAHLAPWDHVTTRVPVVRLDQLLAELAIAHVDLIKIDVEATEVQVLEGARDTLNRDHPHIVCEVLSADSGTRLTEMLRPLGYRFYELHGEGPRQHDMIVPGHDRNYLLTTSPLSDLPSLTSIGS